MNLNHRMVSFLFGAGLLLELVLAPISSGASPVTLTGKTMGTLYHVQVVTTRRVDAADLKRRIDERLLAVNRSMSTYDPDSEISRFNALRAGEALAVSADFRQVMRAARTIYEWTGGAWDGTVLPLVKLWGFEGDAAGHAVPDPEALAAELKKVGFHQIDLSREGTLRKKTDAVTVNLASIAKGFGVDAVSGLLKAEGFTHYLVEIGGEIYAAGLNPDGKPWRVGINRPEANAAFDAVYRVVHLSDRAMATSGDYRHFFEVAGKRYSHVLDPKTGWPVATGVVSASVIAPDCTTADGLATALMVMGHEAGIDLVNRLDGIECLIVVRGPDGSLGDHSSAGL